MNRVSETVTCGRKRPGKPPVRHILVAMGFILVPGKCGRTPTPGCFCKRVRKCLKTLELSFWYVQKSAQEYEKTEVRGLRFEVRVAKGAGGVPE